MPATQNKKTSGKKSSSAAKKPTPKKKESAKPEIPVAVKRQKSAIIMMAVAAFLLFVVFIKGESAWLVMHNGLFGIFGFCVYVIPVALIYLAVVLAKDKTLGSVAANLTAAGIFVALLSGAIHIFANTADYLSTSQLIEQISDVWSKAPSLASGGVIGAIVGGLIARLFGKVGAGITLVILLIVITMFLTGTTLPGLFNALRKPVNRVSEIANEKIEQTAQRREQLEREREEEEKEKEKNKKAFNPPKQPTVAVEKFEDNFITDESTFAPVEEPPMPEIPVVKLPDSTSTTIIEDTIDEAVKQEKKKPLKFFPKKKSNSRIMFFRLLIVLTLLKKRVRAIT